MIFLQTLLAFIVALGSLVIIHELGHYWAARACGVKVLRFSVGMGKVIFSRRLGPDQTEWAISILPLGGYVKMLDAREQTMSRIAAHDRQREFTSQAVWKRIIIVAAGPMANFILAILLFAGLYNYGELEAASKIRVVSQQSAAYQAGLRGDAYITAVNGEPIQAWSELRWQVMQAIIDKVALNVEVRNVSAHGKLIDTFTIPTGGLTPQDLEGDYLGKLGLQLASPKAVLGKIMPDGPAMKAGLREGDLIVRIDDRPIIDSHEFVSLINASPGRLLMVEGIRDGSHFTLNVKPEVQTVQGRQIGLIKVEMRLMPEMVMMRSPPGQALIKAVQRTWDSSILTLKMLGKMITGDVSWKNITGPITIADYAGQTARIGMASYLSFIALISISLGVMNLLPIPMLDGGLLLYYALEVLTGRPVPERIGAIAQRAGIGILMTLMMVAMFNDIVRLLF